MCQRIGFGDDGDKVDTGTEALHDLNVEWLQTVIQRRQGKVIAKDAEDIRVTCRANEVQTSVDSKVRLFVPLGLLLLTHICLMLVINELDNRHPRVAVVDVVTEARCVNNGELDFELLLFKLGLDYFNFGELVELFMVAAGVVLRGGELGGEEGVDECRFTQSRLAWKVGHELGRPD